MKKLLVALWAAAALYAGGVARSQETPDAGAVYATGKKAFTGCAACHFVTDPAIKEDQDWLKLNKITGCINAGKLTDQTRKAVLEFLDSPQTLRPLRVDEKYKPDDNTVCGTIRVPATAGTAFLKAERESIQNGSPPKIRLNWQATPGGQKLPIPVGDYRMIGYRFFAPDPGKDAEKAKIWTMSATDMNGVVDLHIEKSKEALLDFDPVIRGTLSTEAAEDGIKLKFAVRGRKDAVMTLSRDGVMCLPDFVITGEGHKELYRGAFENT